MAWPTDTVDTSNMDAVTDDPSQARADIKNFGDLISAIIAGAVTSATADTVLKRDPNGDATVRRLISNIDIGTAPFSVSSTTKVTNLNADLLDGNEATAFLGASANAVSATKATGLVDGGGGSNLKVAIIDIGTWDMSTTANRNVTHSLTLANIRGVSIIISNDLGTQLWDFDALDLGATETGQRTVRITSTQISMFRAGNGVFDSTSFQSITNRGWIKVWYV